jgi:hypothetical protein
LYHNLTIDGNATFNNINSVQSRNTVGIFIGTTRNFGAGYSNTYFGNICIEKGLTFNVHNTTTTNGHYHSYGVVACHYAGYFEFYGTATIANTEQGFFYLVGVLVDGAILTINGTITLDCRLTGAGVLRVQGTPQTGSTINLNGIYNLMCLDDCRVIDLISFNTGNPASVTTCNSSINAHCFIVTRASHNIVNTANVPIVAGIAIEKVSTVCDINVDYCMFNHFVGPDLEQSKNYSF